MSDFYAGVKIIIDYHLTLPKYGYMITLYVPYGGRGYIFTQW